MTPDVELVGPVVHFIMSLIPLLNWLTIVLGGYLLGHYLAKSAVQAALLRSEVALLHQIVNSRFDKLLRDSEDVARAIGRSEGMIAGKAEEQREQSARDEAEQ